VDRLTETEETILQAIQNDVYIGIDELSEKTGKVRRTVDRAINRLKELGYIERVGSKKGGRFKIKGI
jgi:ATP-dependent DNA helicase RecG